MHHDGTFNTHDRINSVIGMFEEFMKEYKVVVEENVLLKSEVKEVEDASLEPKEAAEVALEKDEEKSVSEVKEKGGKEYLGYVLIEK